MVSLTVWGRPVPQGSWVAFISRNTGKAFAKPSNEKELKAWRREIQEMVALLPCSQSPIDSPTMLHVVCFFGPPPKSRQGDIFCASKPDGDKLLRAICDGITMTKSGRGLVTDDSRIVRKTIDKRWCDTERDQRAEIKLWRLDEHQ
jgi:Holliday junction resolvase RusA-like endonuclease